MVNHLVLYQMLTNKSSSLLFSFEGPGPFVKTEGPVL